MRQASPGLMRQALWPTSEREPRRLRTTQARPSGRCSRRPLSPGTPGVDPTRLGGSVPRGRLELDPSPTPASGGDTSGHRPRASGSPPFETRQSQRKALVAPPGGGGTARLSLPAQPFPVARSKGVHGATAGLSESPGPSGREGEHCPLRPPLYWPAHPLTATPNEALPGACIGIPRSPWGSTCPVGLPELRACIEGLRRLPARPSM